MATDHVAEEDLLEAVTTDCFINDREVVIAEENDDGETDDDVMTIDGTHEGDNGSASATSSTTSDVMEYFPLEKAKSVVWIHFLPNQESFYRKINAFEKKFFVNFVNIRYLTKVTQPI